MFDLRGAPYGFLMPGLLWADQDSYESRDHTLNLLLAYATLSTGLYDETRLLIDGLDAETSREIRNLRNPVAAFIGFYQDMLWPSGMQPKLVSADDTTGEEDPLSSPLLAAVREIDKTSNWVRSGEVVGIGPLAALYYSLYGEMYIRTQLRDDGTPYQYLIDPRSVPDNALDLDNRGFIEWIRWHMPFVRRNMETGKVKHMYRLEVWDREPRAPLTEFGPPEQGPRRLRVWELETAKWNGDNLDLSQLPKPGEQGLVEYRLYNTGQDQLPVDFVPISYAPFMQYTTGGRGWSPLIATLGEIDAINCLATHEHDAVRAALTIMRTLYSEGADTYGRPVPRLDPDDTTEMEIGGERWLGVPGGWKLGPAIPEFDFEGTHEAIDGQEDHLRMQLPELEFQRVLKDAGARSSGEALLTRLEPILARPTRARATALGAKILANQHAITMVQKAGKKWRDLGSYENGDLEHSYRDTPFISRTLLEMAQSTQLLVNAQADFEGAAVASGFDPAVARSMKDLTAEALRQSQLQRSQFSQNIEAQTDDETILARINNRLRPTPTPES